jgi:hypothetical protein
MMVAMRQRKRTPKMEAITMAPVLHAFVDAGVLVGCGVD